MELLLAWLLFGVVTAVVASNKGRSGCGWFILGVLLGPFGFVLSLVVSKDEEVVENAALNSGSVKKCPFCAEIIKREAKVCRYCSRDLESDGSTTSEERPDILSSSELLKECPRCRMFNHADEATGVCGNDITTIEAKEITYGET